jgi:predicted aspartyl protease
MTHRVTLLAGTLGAALVVLAAGSAGACTLRMVGEFKVDLSRGVPIADGEINGVNTKIMIDTGSSVTSLTGVAARDLGLTASTSVDGYVFGASSGGETYSTVLKSLKIGSLSTTSLPPVRVGGDVAVDPDIGMRLGEDLLSQFDVELNLADNVIRLFQADGCTPPQLVYWNQPYSQARLAPGTGIETEVSIDGRPMLAAIDTGASTSLIDTRAAASAGGALAIGDESIAHARLQVSDLSHGAPSMLIGVDFLHAHRVMVDRKDRLIVFSYNGGPIFSASQTPAP